ncbi:MAG: Hsp70 family protein, partial [Nitrospirae bacterium]|nr:Hsp70 family protein [Nitrospirota bacterium]
PPAPRGVPQIDVTFDIDANGIVHVSAKDLGTGKEQSIKITASSGLTEQEIQKMVKESEMHSDEDKKKKQLAEVRNEADTLVYSVEKSLAEFGDKILPDEKVKIQEAMENTRKALAGNDIDAIKNAVALLSSSSHKLAEEMYKKTASPQQGAAGAGAESGGKKEEKVVEAEFEEVDKDKK